MGVAGHLAVILRWGNPVKCLSNGTTSKLPACSPHCLFSAEWEGVSSLPISKSLISSDFESNKSLQLQRRTLYRLSTQGFELLLLKVDRFIIEIELY